MKTLKKTVSRLLLLFKKKRNFPPAGANFYVTKHSKQYVLKNGNSYVTKGM